MSKLAYQPHIDGLRAVAVLSVLIYHINNSWLPGGFVGVDVFFVISGFLITKIISNSIKEDKFSIKVFYTHRIKRILPVYFLVSSVSIGFAWLIYFPNDLKDFANSLLSSTFFVSNLYFWKTSGYFAGSIDLKPLVHTWSLSVEEQFYVFWPLTLVLVYKFKSPIYTKLSLLVLISASLCLSYILSNSNPDFAYYSIVTRMFELIIGAVAAIYVKDSSIESKSLSYLGLFLIIASFIFIDKNLSFPGIVAVMPSLGAVFLIISARSNSLPIKILETRVAVSIGIISYSLYMWHWPILSFARYYFTNLDTFRVISIVVLIFCLSYFTRYTVEQRVIRSKLGFGKSFGLLFVLPATIFLSVAIYINFNEGVKTRFPSKDLTLIEQTYSGNHQCSKEKFELIFEDECFIRSSKTQPKKKILLWGDSHANHFSGFFEEAAKYEAIDVYNMSFPGCPPIAGVYRINRTYSKACYLHNLKVNDMLLAGDKFDYVALAANWSNYPLGDNLADDSNKEVSISNSHRAFYGNLRKQLELFSQKGIKVIFFNSVPNFQNDASQCELKHFIFGYPQNAQFCERPVQEIKQRRSVFDRFINDFVKPLNGVFVLDFVDFFCRQGICKTIADGAMMYHDKNHLSDFGSRALYRETFKNGKTLLSLFRNAPLTSTTISSD